MDDFVFNSDGSIDVRIGPGASITLQQEITDLQISPRLCTHKRERLLLAGHRTHLTRRATSQLRDLPAVR